MDIRYGTPDHERLHGDDPQGNHAVLSGRICYRSAVVDEDGHTASVMVLEIGARSRRTQHPMPTDTRQAKGESYLTMLLLSGENPGWGESHRVLASDEGSSVGGMTLVVDANMRVCDLVRYASGILEKSE